MMTGEIGATSLLLTTHEEEVSAEFSRDIRIELKQLNSLPCGKD